MLDPDALEVLDERALRMIIRGTLGLTGEALLESLVRALAELLGARLVLVGQLRGDRLRARAMWHDGAIAPNVEYGLVGTPCESVLAKGARFITHDVRGAFPDHALLVELGAESYFATPLTSTAGGDRPIGVLAVVHDQPLEDTPATRAVLTIFATRAAMEIERLHAEVETRETSEALLRARSALLALAQRDDSDLHCTLRAIIATDARTIGVERVSYWSIAEDRSQIACEALYTGATESFAHGAVLLARDYPSYFEALLSTRAIVADDAWVDPRTREFTRDYFVPTGITSMLDVPVWHRGQLAGVVCHEHVGAARTWTTAEQDFALAIAGVVAVALEASERRRAEDRYRQVARATNDVVWDWDLVSGRLELSEGVAAAFRHAPEVVEPTIDWWTRHIHPDDVARISASLGAAIAGDQSSWMDEYRFLRGDGTMAIVGDRGVITRDERGVAVRMIGAMVDLTERRHLEARLTVADRMASLGTLAAGIAHEVNNPLAYILANIDHALEELRTHPSLGDVADGLREARQGAARVCEIVRDLKTFSKSDDAPHGPIDIGPVIESSINMTWNEIRHRARLVRELRPTPPVDASEARLGQVVINLLVNAAQSFPEGVAGDQEIRVVTDTDARGWAVIEVRDNGPGIAPEIRSRIFDPFFTTKAIGGGTGLGLSICHSIVSACGGEITVDSAPGAGCVVRVVLPRSRGVVVTRASSAAPAPVPVTRPRVLVIDDDPLVGTAVRRMLARSCEVEVEKDARVALTRLASGPHVDVVICDLMMPGVTGMELYAELERSDPARLESIIFMTGGAFTAGAQEFLERVACPRLEKPFTKQALLELIRELLGPGDDAPSRDPGEITSR